VVKEKKEVEKTPTMLAEKDEKESLNVHQAGFGSYIENYFIKEIYIDIIMKL
jgi:hypothetical protein